MCTALRAEGAPFCTSMSNSGYMPVLQSERLDGSGYGFQILAANDDIDVFG